MKKMKKLVSLLLVLVMVFTMFPATAFAASPEMTLRVADVQAIVGSTVDVTLNLEGNPGVAALKVKVDFDTSILTLVNVDFNEAMEGQFQMPQTMNSPVSLTWFNGAENFTGETANFVTLTFQVSDTAPSDCTTELSVSYNSRDIYDITEADVRLNVVNGSVTVRPCVPGDINDDGETNLRDLTRLFQYLADWDVEVNELVLDVNGDGSVDLKDQTRLFQYLADWDVVIYPVPVAEQQKNYLYGYFVEDTQSMGVDYCYTDIVNFGDADGKKIPDIKQPIEQNTMVSLGAPDGTTMAATFGKLARYVINKYGEIEVLDGKDFGLMVEGGYIVAGGTEIYDGGNHAVAAVNNDTRYMVRAYDWITGDYNYQVYVGTNSLPKDIFGADERDSYAQKIQYLTDVAGTATHVFIDVEACGREEAFYVEEYVGEGEAVFHSSAFSGWNVYIAMFSDGTERCVLSAETLQIVPGGVLRVDGYYAKAVKAGALNYEGLPAYIVQGEFSSSAVSEQMMDCFGRPARLWVVTNEYGAQIMRKTVSAVPDYTFTENVDLIAELSDRYSYEQGNQSYAMVSTYVNGAFVRTANTLATASTLTGNGILTEVFVDGDEITVVIIETFIGEVVQATKMPATVTLQNGYKLENTTGLKVGDYVLYHECAGQVKPSALAPGNHMDAIRATVATATVGATIYLHDVQKVNPTVENVIHASRGVNGIDWLDESYFQTADRKFEYAANYGADILGRAVRPADLISVTNLDAGINGTMEDCNDYDIFMNEHGFVMYYTIHEQVHDYQYGYVVEGTHTSSTTAVDDLSYTEYFFDIVDFSAACNNDVAAEEYTWNNTVSLDDGTAGSSQSGHLVRYIMNEDGQAEILGDWDYAIKAEDAYLVPGVAQIYGTNIYANNYTQYMVRTYNWVTGEYNYNVYVGYRNLPDTLLGYKQVNDGSWNGDDAEYISTLQYLVGSDPDDAQNIATHVFVDVVYVGVQDTFYILGVESIGSDQTLYPFINDYTIYSALIDGEKAYIAVADDDAWGIGSSMPGVNVRNALYTAKLQVIDAQTVNGLPIYVATSPVDPATWNVVAINGGLITIDQVSSTLVIEPGYIQIADDAVINVVHPLYKDDEFTNEPDYAIFGGEGISAEERDAAFDEFFAYYDWNIAEMKVYATTEEIPVWDVIIIEVTELWIELEPAY